MRQSGQIAKYSAAEPAQVRMVQFSSFSKEELVIFIFYPRNHGQSPKSQNQDSTKATDQSLEVPMFFISGPNDLRLGVSTMDQKC